MRYAIGLSLTFLLLASSAARAHEDTDNPEHHHSMVGEAPAVRTRADGSRTVTGLGRFYRRVPLVDHQQPDEFHVICHGRGTVHGECVASGPVSQSGKTGRLVRQDNRTGELLRDEQGEIVYYGPPREITGRKRLPDGSLVPSAWGIMNHNAARLRRERPEDPPPTEREDFSQGIRGRLDFDVQGRAFLGGVCTKRVFGACTEVTVEAGQCIEWFEHLPSGLRRESRECVPGG